MQQPRQVIWGLPCRWPCPCLAVWRREEHHLGWSRLVAWLSILLLCAQLGTTSPHPAATVRRWKFGHSHMGRCVCGTRGRAWQSANRSLQRSPCPGQAAYGKGGAGCGAKRASVWRGGGQPRFCPFTWQMLAKLRCMPGPSLGTGNTAGNKTKFLPSKADGPHRKTENEQIRK